ncbi:MAG: LPS assembly protein LptD, partial [Gammaproteobacteria bacterium]|nr:LPS assembly protein LptD [Gammaproteobacteria bacterium]
MLGSKPHWIVIASFGCIMPVAHADELPCPSQNPQAAATPPAAQSGTGGPAPATAAGSVPAGPGGTGRPSGKSVGPISVTSDEATLGVDGNAILRGNVEARQGERQIRAEHIEYDSKSGAMRSDGHIELQDPLVHITGSSGSYSAATGAEFRDAQFNLRQRAARGSARDLALTPEGQLRLQGVTFTTCPLHDESWHLKANSIVLDTHDKIGTGRDARVDFMGVPLIYLPWVSFPLSNERKSGFLFPSIGNTSINGLQLSVPYYWNIAPNADFTFQPIYYSKAGIDLGGDFRQMTQSQRGELEWNYLPYDQAFGASRSRVQLTELAELPWDWRLNVSAANVSDRHYFEDFSNGPEGASTAFLERRATFSYRSEHWSIDAEAQQYQTIDYTLAEPDRPYARVPHLAVDAADALGPNDVLRYGFYSEVVNFQHTESPEPVTTGWRADVMPLASLDLTGPGYFLRPAFAWRGTQYELDSLGPGQTKRSPSRTVPITSLDTGLMFERPAGSRAQRRLTLEPRIMYLDVPYRAQDQLPVFDTAVPDLNPVQLFRTNRYVGADRVSDANQVSVGLTSRLLDAQSGQQFIAGTFGQTYYFEIPRVTLPGETPITAGRSDWVAQLSLAAFEDWSADAGVQWDPQNRRSQRTTVNVQYKPRPNSVINLAYRYERFTTVNELIPQTVDGVEQLVSTPVQQGFDQIEFSAAWPIKHSWQVYLREVYSLRDPQQPQGQELERFIGFEYRACCWRVRLGAR